MIIFPLTLCNIVSCPPPSFGFVPDKVVQDNIWNTNAVSFYLDLYSWQVAWIIFHLQQSRRPVRSTLYYNTSTSFNFKKQLSMSHLTPPTSNLIGCRPIAVQREKRVKCRHSNPSKACFFGHRLSQWHYSLVLYGTSHLLHCTIIG